MNVEKKLGSLKEYVKSKSLSEAEKLLKEAEKRSKEIEEEYKKKAEDTYAHILDDAKKKVEDFEKREKAQSEAKSSRMLLDAKNGILTSAANELKERICSLNSDRRYDKLLEKLMKEAIETLEEKEVVIRFRKEDKEKVLELAKEFEKALDVNITLSDEYAEISGGVIVSSKDGRVEVENTLENKFEEMKDDFLRVLFSKLNVNG